MPGVPPHVGYDECSACLPTLLTRAAASTEKGASVAPSAPQITPCEAAPEVDAVPQHGGDGGGVAAIGRLALACMKRRPLPSGYGAATFFLAHAVGCRIL
jgi:hypothetical protein